MNGPYAFLSYASEDKVVVTGLRRILEINGIAAWQDRAELHVGDKLDESIKRAIMDAAWIVPVVSRHTLRSSWVLKEYVAATGEVAAPEASPRTRGARRPTPRRNLYPVVITEDGDADPRAVLRSSWLSDKFEPYVNAFLPRREPKASDFGDLIGSIKQKWPELAPNAGFGVDGSPEANSRRLLWSTFPSRFSKLEGRFRELVWDPKLAVWVVVGLPNSGKSALLSWLQARCPFATRLDVGSDRYGSLEARLCDVVVEVIMYDNIWDDAAMLRTLSAVEQQRSRTRLQVITCTPNQLPMVVERLRRMNVSYSIAHERGVGFGDTKCLVDAHAQDPTFRSRARQLVEGTEARRHEVCPLARSKTAKPDESAACLSADGTPMDWDNAEQVSAFLWERISKTWSPFNPAAARYDETAGVAPASQPNPEAVLRDGEIDFRQPEPPEAVFNSSLYEAAHRLQHFGDADRFCPETGLPTLETWKLDYVKRTFFEGLSASQQDAVRSVVRFDGNWLPRADQREDLALLERCGVVTQRGATFRIADRIFAQYFVPPIVIHHLSDLHTKVGATSLPSTLLAYRDEILADESRRPHLLVVSGDLFGELYTVGEGTEVPVEHPLRGWFAKAKELIEQKLHPFIPLRESPRLFVVGGNQDVDPVTIEHASRRAFWSACRRRKTLQSMFHEVAHHPYSDLQVDGAEPALGTSEARSDTDLARVFKVGPLRIALIDSCAYGTDETEHQSSAWWLDVLYGLLLMSKEGKDSIYPPSPGVSTTPLGEQLEALLPLPAAGPAGGFLNGIASLFKDDRLSPRQEFLRKISRSITDCEPGYVSQQTLETLRKLANGQRQSAKEVVNLAVLHHPLGSAPRDRGEALGELKNAGQVREVLANAHVALAMHGHLHMHWLDEFSTPMRSDWLLRALSAPALGGSHENDALGFNEVRVRWEGSQARVLQRSFTRHAGAWAAGRAHEFSPGSYENAVLDV